jgi:hypothetical protein
MTEVSEEVKTIIISVLYPNVKPNRVYESCKLFHCYFDESNTSNSINKEAFIRTLYKGYSEVQKVQNVQNV